MVFSGVGKTAAEIDAALAAGMFGFFNCESEPELALIDALAHRRGMQARVAMRVNPDVEAVTHAYISTGRLAHKFGVDIGEAEAVYERARAARESADRRRELPHRVAACWTRAGDGSGGPGARTDRAACAPRDSISATPTWAAGWVWRTSHEEVAPEIGRFRGGSSGAGRRARACMWRSSRAGPS